MKPEKRLELDRLITDLLEEALGPEDRATLEQWLREDYECRRHYLAMLDQHARLLTAPVLASGRLTPASTPKASTAKAWRQPAVLAAVAAVVFAGMLLGYTLFWKQPPSVSAGVSEEQTDAGCAVLAQCLDAQFEGRPHTPLQPGAMLSPGVLRLKAGLARIEFFSGATLLLEGPATLEIRSSWEAVCPQGKARVRVPPPAQGFQLHVPGMKLVDLGTEFGVVADAGGASQVTVFEGAVEAHPENATMRLLKTGENLRHGESGLLSGNVAPLPLTSLEQFDQLALTRAQERHDAWWAWFQNLRQDPRLIACYAFKHWKDDRWDRLVNNFTQPPVPSRSGAAVGVRWSRGRWPMKDALEFKGPGDRVRINLGTEAYSAITLACWVRVDALDRRYNALLLTDGYEAGEPHWQIYEDGRLMFSIAYPDPAKRGLENNRTNQIYYSPSIFNLGNQRRWHHVAVTYDNQTGAAVQYVDGQEISRETHPAHVPDRPISFGPSELGNWGLSTDGHKFPIRNLNGSLDEFLIYKTALSGDDVRQIYEAGRPD